MLGTKSGANVSWVLHKEGRTETGGLGAEGGIAFQKDNYVNQNLVETERNSCLEQK